jgi:hypothetical protein
LAVDAALVIELVLGVTGDAAIAPASIGVDPDGGSWRWLREAQVRVRDRDRLPRDLGQRGASPRTFTLDLPSGGGAVASTWSADDAVFDGEPGVPPPVRSYQLEDVDPENPTPPVDPGSEPKKGLSDEEIASRTW